jgi:uncharacterized membrane protein YhaH (DUF805 family)
MKTLIKFCAGTIFISLLVGLFYPRVTNACDIYYQGGGCYSGATEWYQGNERPHGYGHMRSKDWSYHGMYWNGEFHGKGTLEFQSGHKYRGKWYEGKKQGQGTYWWPSGQKYEGEWKDDNQHGKGTLVYKNGTKFVGTFKKDSEWTGTYYSKTGKVTGALKTGQRVQKQTSSSSGARVYCYNSNYNSFYRSSTSSCSKGNLKISKEEFKNKRLESAPNAYKVWCAYSGGVAQVTSFTCNNWNGKSFQTKSSAQTEFRKVKPLDMSQRNTTVASNPPATSVGSWIEGFWKNLQTTKLSRSSQWSISKTFGIQINDLVAQLGKYVALFLCLLFLCWRGKEGKNAFGWYFSVLGKYAVFSGRAQRKEFWYFWLMHALVSVALGLAEERFDLTPDTDASVLFLIYGLAILLPGFAVNARRLHDTGRSGWWQLVGLVPIVGPVVFLVLCTFDSHPAANRYGPSPKMGGGNVPPTGSREDNSSGSSYSPAEEFLRPKRKEMEDVVDSQNTPPTNTVEPTTVIVSDSDDELYEQAWREIEEGKQDKALWARLYAGHEGDESIIKGEYIKHRVLQKKLLLKEAEQVAVRRQREEEDKLDQILAESRRNNLENESRIKNKLKEEDDRQKKIEEETKRKQLEEEKRKIALDKKELLRLEKDQREEEIDRLRSIARDKQEHLRLEEEQKAEFDRLKKIEREQNQKQKSKEEREASKARQERREFWDQSVTDNNPTQKFEIDETKSDREVEEELLSRLAAVERFNVWETTDGANNRTQLLAAVTRCDQVSILRWIKSGIDPSIVLHSTDKSVMKVLENSPEIKQIFDASKRLKEKGIDLPS